jgi:hypothetical protein
VKLHRAGDDCRDACGRQRTDVVPKDKISRAINANTPKRFTKHFVALATTELMQEIFQAVGRRLFVTFQPQEPCDLVVAQEVHFTAKY